jgi:photosystem II PsbZ protein|uniref:Photosystem II reaction center protein Z n=1 Tax=Eutreptiella gymnastica TaxID=73025 RepID=I0J3N7_9EUGL|nr:photosystem II protein Z [Eutreptiella gymnastica]CCE26510.1 photosystem II protein Z [Eutreptiella gymnastica]|tara:strand:- start:4826 stop:5020 length:195 start_codon:yes stop_codon:yes gene_type:complete
MDIILVFQFSILALIALSFLMVIAVPVVFATPEGWNSNKNYILTGAAAWAGLVFVVGSLNSVVI